MRCLPASAPIGRQRRSKVRPRVSAPPGLRRRAARAGSGRLPFAPLDARWRGIPSHCGALGATWLGSLDTPRLAGTGRSVLAAHRTLEGATRHGRFLLHSPAHLRRADPRIPSGCAAGAWGGAGAGRTLLRSRRRNVAANARGLSRRTLGRTLDSWRASRLHRRSGEGSPRVDGLAALETGVARPAHGTRRCAGRPLLGSVPAQRRTAARLRRRRGVSTFRSASGISIEGARRPLHAGRYGDVRFRAPCQRALLDIRSSTFADPAFAKTAQSRVVAAQIHQLRTDPPQLGCRRALARAPAVRRTSPIWAMDRPVVVTMRAVGQVVVAEVPRADEVAVGPDAVVVVDVVARRVVEPQDAVAVRPGGALAVDRARAVHGVRGGGLLDHPRLRFQHGNEQIHRYGAAQIEQPGAAEVFLRAGNPHLEPVLLAAFGNGVFAGAPTRGRAARPGPPRLRRRGRPAPLRRAGSPRRRNPCGRSAVRRS